jgi:hypothetical protein
MEGGSVPEAARGKPEFRLKGDATPASGRENPGKGRRASR